jgi:phage gp36-like protein
MIYATLADLVAQFGDREVIAIADRNDDGIPDQPLVDSALQRASDTMDAYLAARYALPLASIPRQLVDVCCDIARYKLCGAEVTETEAVRLRYKDALKTLELIRDGKLDIGLTVTGQPVADIASIQIIGGSRQFDRTSLSDF